MALTKNMNVMKALIEEILRRRGANPNTTARDIRVALGCLKLIIEEPMVYILADSVRFADAFRDSFDRTCLYIDTMEDCLSVQSGTVVALHTGDKSDRQRIRYNQMLETLKGRPEVVVWHIGRWEPR